MNPLRGIGIVLCAALLMGASATQSAAQGDALPVTVGLAPVGWFVEQIGGDHVAVSVMLPPGADPHSFEPMPRQLVALSKTRLYVASGVPFETTWLDRFRAANTAMTIVHADRGITRIPLADTHDGDGHDGGGGHDGDDDPHIWLSPANALIMAATIRDALSAADPEYSDIYLARYTSLVSDIRDIDETIRALFAKRRTDTFLVFHPAWGYFAHAYGLRQVAVEVAGREPGAADLKHVIDIARTDSVRVVFVQPHFSMRAARTVADALGAAIVVANPLAGDWAENLLTVASAVAKAIQ